MNLEYSNLRYNNYEHVNKENLLTFDLTVRDLDNSFLNGEKFDFTLVVSDDPKYNTTEIAKQILTDYKNEKIDISKIEEYDYPGPLENLSDLKINELKKFKNKLIDEGFVSFDSDVFDINDKTLSRLSSTLQSLLYLESQNKLDRKTYIHKWVSQTGIIHDFTIDQLIELNALIINEVQSIILRYNYLVYDVIPTITDKKELYFLDWWHYAGNNDNQ